MRRRVQPADGFTLVELLILLALVGTAVGFSIESLSNFREAQRARSGVTRLLTVLDTAKSRAVTLDQVAIVDFSPGGLSTSDGFYEVFIDLDDDGARDAGENAAANLTDVTSRGGMIGYQLPAGLSFSRPGGVATGPLGIPTAADGVTFTGDRISFFPDGTSPEAGHVTMTDASGRTFAVTLTAGGAVHVHRLNGSTWQ